MPVDELFATLEDGAPCADAGELEVTGVPPELEQQMSSIFVPPFLNSDVRRFAEHRAVWRRSAAQARGVLARAALRVT